MTERVLTRPQRVALMGLGEGPMQGRETEGDITYPLQLVALGLAECERSAGWVRIQLSDLGVRAVARIQQRGPGAPVVIHERPAAPPPESAVERKRWNEPRPLPPRGQRRVVAKRKSS